MDDMREVEEGLRAALRHVPAPEGFTERVMARIAASKAHPEAPARERRGAALLLHMRSAASWWVAAAAALLLAVGGGDALHLRWQHQQQRAQAAQEQVDLAMQLTDHALTEVQVNLDRSHAGKLTQLWTEAVQ